MPIRISHDVDMSKYGQAMQQAATNVTANNRLEKYASYLAGLQSANQQYGLGLGSLQLQEKKVDQDFSLDRYRAQLQGQELAGQLGRWQTQSEADLIRAYATQQQAAAGTLRTMMGV